jgi:superfamily II DNA or RNA helicase
MSTQKRANLFNTYQKLPAEQLAIMNLMSVYNGYCSNTLLCKFLSNGLNFKDDLAKPLKLDVVAAYAQILVDRGFLEELSAQKTRRCNRLIVEMISRHLVATGQFQRYVDVINEFSPRGPSHFRYPYPQDCIRDARIHFYRHDFAKVNESLEVGRKLSNLPNNIDLYLTWILNPFEQTYFNELPKMVAKQLAGFIGLHQLLYLYNDPAVNQTLLQQTKIEDAKGTEFSVRVLAELQWLRGDTDGLANILSRTGDPELDALSAALVFLRGDGIQAIKQFETALSLLRKSSGKRTSYFYGLAGIFYPLAILKSGDAAQKAKLPALLNQATKTECYWATVYHYLTSFQQFLQGNLAIKENLLRVDLTFKPSSGFKNTGEPEIITTSPGLHNFFLLFIKFWIKADHFEKVSASDVKLYHYLIDNRYQWLAAELADLFKQIEPNNAKKWTISGANQSKPVLASLFASRSDWDLALDALLNMNKSDNKDLSKVPQDEKLVRLIWLVNFNEFSTSITIEPREQKQQAKGGWTKGRAIALKRLHTERDSFDYLTEQDHKLLNSLKEYRDDSWYGSTYFEFSQKMPLYLVGHPCLFWADMPEVHVDVVKGDVELRVIKTEKNDRIKISLQPTFYSDQKIQISKESPTRLKVIEITNEHHKIAAILGPKGLEVPLAAQDRVLQTLTSISSLLTVHSDIGGSSNTAEQVTADTTPRVHLLPLGAGLRVGLYMRPLGTGGAYYQPGNGGASVLAELDGKPVQAKRDLALEKQRAKEVIQACPGFSQAEQDNSGDWLLEEPEQCLELLLQLQALPPDQAQVEWPEGVKFKLLGQSTGSGFNLNIKQEHDWFALQGELRVNENTVIEIQQLLGLLNAGQGRFLQLQDGQFIALTDAFRRRLEDLKAYADITGKKVRINPLAALTLDDWDDSLGSIKADKHWQAHMQRLRSARKFQPVLPSTFQAELRDYQMDGYIWLARLAQWGVGACLADDMGLGKTVQGLALLVDRAPNGPSLIVAPTSVCMNWEKEAKRFAPTLKPQLLGTGDRQRVLENLEPFDLLICSYGLLQQEQVADMLAKIRFQTVILDEAQAIKNTATRRSQGAMNLQGDFKIIMTGTPLENHLGELWNLYRFINPGLLGSQEQFNQRFAGPIERDRNSLAKQQLKKLIQPFILRRTKTQVLQELPPRTEIPVYVELSNEEMAFYEALRRESLQILTSTETQAGQKHLLILAAITKLRRSCCNTRLANAEISLPSSKLAAFGDIVDELLDNKHKALVFSQFVDHLQIIKDYIEQRGIRYQYLDGSTPIKERQKRVDAFQRGEGELFLISLKAGGVGINLTAADYVIHMDPWWNPAVEDQASDRAHRMGQLRPVTIYRMIAKDTIEEKIVALHSHKRDLADSLLDGADISGKMSADDLLGLMRSED